MEMKITSECGKLHCIIHLIHILLIKVESWLSEPQLTDCSDYPACKTVYTK